MKLVIEGKSAPKKKDAREAKLIKEKIKSSKTYKEVLSLLDQLPDSQSAAFYVGGGINGNVVIREVANNKKLKLMDKIAGDKLILGEGETRKSKIYQLTVTFSDLLDLAIESKTKVVFEQVRNEDLIKTKVERGPNTVCVAENGELYLWTFVRSETPDADEAEIGAKLKPGRRKKDKQKKFLEFQKDSPVQMSLFRLFEKEKDYSHTIELYDFIPKYVWGKSKRIEGKFLEPISREFICRGTPYKVVLLPARIQTETGDYVDYFPGKREELVEDALRKLMSDIQGVFLDDAAGTTFTLYQLQTELKNRGHSYSYDQLKESLEILAKTDIELESEENETKIIFRAIETLGLSGKDGETQTFVRFSPLVTQSIKKGTFRLINYEKVMSYKTTIARQLHKRMSHFYTQASLTEKYHILLSTIIRDFGLTRYSQLRNNLTEVEKGIEELKEKNIIINCAIDKIFDVNPKTKLNDVKFTFQPHPFFVEEIKKANYRINTLKVRLENPDSNDR